MHGNNCRSFISQVYKATSQLVRLPTHGLGIEHGRPRTGSDPTPIKAVKGARLRNFRQFQH